jgi:uncharacterized coiled-coil DUF342 family protein
MNEPDFILLMIAILAFMVLVVAVSLYAMNRVLVKKTLETDEELKHNFQMFGNQLVEEFTGLLDAMHRDALEKNRAALDRLMEAGVEADKEGEKRLSDRLDSLSKEIKGVKKELAKISELAPDPKKQAEALSDAVSGIRSQIDRQENLMRKLSEEARGDKGEDERLERVLSELAELRKRLDELATHSESSAA